MSATDEPRFTCCNKPVATAKVLPPTLLPAALATRQRMLKVKCEHASEACSQSWTNRIRAAMSQQKMTLVVVGKDGRSAFALGQCVTVAVSRRAQAHSMILCALQPFIWLCNHHPSQWRGITHCTQVPERAGSSSSLKTIQMQLMWQVHQLMVRTPQKVLPPFLNWRSLPICCYAFDTDGFRHDPI